MIIMIREQAFAPGDIYPEMMNKAIVEHGEDGKNYKVR
jgi:hypothetical protein